MFLVGAMTALTLAGCAPSADTADSSDTGSKQIRTAFIIPGSISDGAFGTLSFQGYESVKDADFMKEATYIEGVSAVTDAAKAIRDYVADGYDVVWAQSGLHSAAVMEIAPEFPDTVFVALAAAPKDETFDNVWFSALECESAYYLAGAIAAKKSETGTIGLVGGRENPLYVACSMAYEQGATDTDPNVKVLKAFTGDYNDPIKSKEAAASQIQSGADVIAHFQDLGMTGVVAAAEESTKAGSQVWVIGKGSDQYEQAPDVILTSVVYDYGVSMRNILAKVANEGQKSGVGPISLADGSVYLADSRGRIDEETQKMVDELTQKLINGEIKYTTQYDIE